MNKYREYINEIVQFYLTLLKYLFLSLIVFISSLYNFYLISFYLPSLILAYPGINRRSEFKIENQACLNYIIQERGEPDLDGLYIPFTIGVIIASVTLGHTPDLPNNYIVTVQKFGWFGLPRGYTVVNCANYII